MDILFPFATYWPFYAAFTAMVLMLLAVDLGVFHRHAHAVSFRASLGWSIVWIVLAMAFNGVFYYYASAQHGAEAGERLALEFLTGYVVEKALAVDNIFIFVMVFAALGIPAQFQHRVLFYGILGALAFRAVFIALGSVLMQYHWVVVLFGVLLLLTGVKMLVAAGKTDDPSKSLPMRVARRLLPVTNELHGQSFLVRIDGHWKATPLMVALVVLELSDVIFAIDSVPAIFALTREPLIVFTSNIFAILGLRSMYFMLAGVVERFSLIRYSLAAILVFVGLKMVWLNEWYGGKFPISYSLGIIGALLLAGIVASLLRSPAAASASPGAGERARAV